MEPRNLHFIKNHRRFRCQGSSNPLCKLSPRVPEQRGRPGCWFRELPEGNCWWSAQILAVGEASAGRWGPRSLTLLHPWGQELLLCEVRRSFLRAGPRNGSAAGGGVVRGLRLWGRSGPIARRPPGTLPLVSVVMALAGLWGVISDSEQ